MRIIFTSAVLICLFCLSALAETNSFAEIKTIPLRQEFGTRQGWHVTAWQPKGEDAETGDVSTRICFWTSENKKREHCTSITSALANSDTIYHYQTVKELSVVPAPHLIKFVTEFYGGGSGFLEQVSFWLYDKRTDSFSEAGLVTLTDQSEYQLIDQNFFVTADFHWGEGEGHFAPHRFTITAYKFVLNVGYEKAFSYVTTAKYWSWDSTDKIDVISHEMANIKKWLADAK